MTAKAPLAERFWSKVKKGDGCWEWTGGKNDQGYGRLCDDPSTRRRMAHRVSWEIHNGPIPAGMCVCHHCDNPLCVNPTHLFVGTQRDNVLDMLAKGRAAWSGHTHCPRGHDLNAEENSYRRPGSGYRMCRACNRENRRQLAAAKRARARS